MKKVLLLTVTSVAYVYFLFGWINKSEIKPATIAASVQNSQPLSTKIEQTEPKLLVSSTTVMQGEPIMIQVAGKILNPATTSPVSIYFNGKPIPTFIYNSKPTAFVAIDLYGKTGKFDVLAKNIGSTTLESVVNVVARPKVSAPLGIPAKLGGNTAVSQKNLVNNLTKENTLIKNVFSAKEFLWNQSFQYPVKNPIVTDSFGYSRLTGAYSVSHLGTDFRAEEGTSIMAMNKGIVRFARKTVVYGNMIIIDHGFGLETLYAHLSKMNIKEGQGVEKGQIIGLSGQTGYAEQPHLHVSVKINKISIDPIKFLQFFK